MKRLICFFISLMLVLSGEPMPMTFSQEQQLTSEPQNHVLTNIHVWTPDSQKIVYDVRYHEFNGTRIETITLDAKREVLYASQNGASCGVVTCSPVEEKYVFIHGPEFPTEDWQYAFDHRQGVILHHSRLSHLDARNIVPPFTPGALRGGSHVHVFSGDGRWVSFTYNDHVLNHFAGNEEHEVDQRNVGISIPLGRTVTVPKTHPRNLDSEYFSFLVTRTVNDPQPGSDEINHACEEGWVGNNGYLKPDGLRQHRAIAFLGNVLTETGETLTEVFLVDLPDHLEEQLGNYPAESDPWLLAGTATQRPRPPQGVVQRRLTFTQDHKYPGVFGPRHWLRSSPDGSRIAFLMRDDNATVQIWTVSPHGGDPEQITFGDEPVASAFSWSPCGKYLACVKTNRIVITDVLTHESIFLTEPSETPISDLAVVFSPDGQKIAYLREILHENGNLYDQVFICPVKD